MLSSFGGFRPARGSASTDEELVAMMAAIGAERGATVTLDAHTMRTEYDAHRDQADKDAMGLASYALRLARSEEFGSVVVSKTQLAERMAALILDDLLWRGADAVSAERPVAEMLISVFRVT